MAAQDPAAWLRSHREPSARNLLNVTLRLRSGRGQPNSKDLSGALLETMRLNNVKQFSEILSLVADDRLKEDSLTAAWRKAWAGGLPLNEEMKRDAVLTMVLLRYKLSQGTRQYSPQPLAWGALWNLVDQLLDDAGNLLILLERNPEEADEIVMLAMRSALAIRALKGYFRRSYDEQVPWEEIEYLLALFVEARTCYRTLAFLVTGTDSITTHLKFFLDKVDELRKKYRDRADCEDAMTEMKQKIGERSQVRAGVDVDQRMAAITEDFVLLRDWHSLGELVDAVKAAIDALQLSETEWKEWGWLALQRSLFLAGEKMKNTSGSPNLSSHYVQFVELAVAEGIREVLCNGIRDTLAHSPSGTNADALTMSVLESKEERQRLGEDLKRVLKTVSTMLLEAEYQLLMKRRNYQDAWQTMRVMVSQRKVKANAGDLVYSEVASILECENKTKNVSDITKLIDKLRTIASSIQTIPSINKDLFSRESKHLNDTLCAAVYKHCPQHFQRIHQLLEWRCAQSLRICEDDLNKAFGTGGGGSGTTSSRAVGRAISALQAIEDCEQSVKCYAVEGGLQALASRWHKDDHTPPPPLLELYSPSLFGRNLRNHLNHDDLAVRLFFPTSMELSSLWTLVRVGDVSASGSGGAEPRRTSTEPTDENIALLRLVQLKDDLFRGAREGDLDKVQHAVELGVDISSRDCRGRTLLHAAAEAGQAHVVDWLLRLGPRAVDPLARDWEGRSALHNAATKEVAEALLTAGQVDPDMMRFTPIHTAARSGRADVVQALIPHFDLNAHDNAGDLTPLHLAALAGDCGTVRLLLLAGARYEVSMEACTPLSCAAHTGSAPTASLLLQPPPPLLPRPSDTNCWGAASVAGRYRRVEVFSTLMAELQRRGAQLADPAVFDAVLGVAVWGSTEAAAELLDRWPVAVHLQFLPAGVTILSYAASCGHADLVRTLLQRGADLLQRNRYSQTALHAAAQEGSVEVINALWDHTGFTLTEQSPARREALERLWKGEGERVPPLWFAADNGHLPAVERLLELGANIDTGVLIKPWSSPLCAAALRGHDKVVQKLMDKKARLYHSRESTGTPLQAAAENGRLGAMQLLLPNGSLGKRERSERLDMLEGFLGPEGVTPLHRAVRSGSHGVVKHLLEWEVKQLIPHYDRMTKKGRSPLWKSLTLYRKDSEGRTPLQWCVLCDAPCKVFREVLKYMEDKRVMALGGKEVLDLRDMVQEALGIVDIVHRRQTTEYGRAPRSDMMKEVLQESLQRLKARLQESAAAAVVPQQT